MAYRMTLSPCNAMPKSGISRRSSHKRRGQPSLAVLPDAEAYQPMTAAVFCRLAAATY